MLRPRLFGLACGFLGVPSLALAQAFGPPPAEVITQTFETFSSSSFVLIGGFVVSALAWAYVLIRGAERLDGKVSPKIIRAGLERELVNTYTMTLEPNPFAAALLDDNPFHSEQLFFSFDLDEANEPRAYNGVLEVEVAKAEGSLQKDLLAAILALEALKAERDKATDSLYELDGLIAKIASDDDFLDDYARLKRKRQQDARDFDELEKKLGAVEMTVQDLLDQRTALKDAKALLETKGQVAQALEQPLPVGRGRTQELSVEDVLDLIRAYVETTNLEAGQGFETPLASPVGER